ncbi:MAG: hypothetical protein ACRC5H_02705 [Treponemataceae bacterium]
MKELVNEIATELGDLQSSIAYGEVTATLKIHNYKIVRVDYYKTQQSRVVIKGDCNEI